MTTGIILRSLEVRYPKVSRRIKKIAEAKKMSEHEAVLFCLKGETTHQGECVKNWSKRPFCRPRGETTSREGEAKRGVGGVRPPKHSNTQTLKHSQSRQALHPSPFTLHLTRKEARHG